MEIPIRTPVLFRPVAGRGVPAAKSYETICLRASLSTLAPSQTRPRDAPEVLLLRGARKAFSEDSYCHSQSEMTRDYAC
jgi:hypothetical protein